MNTQHGCRWEDFPKTVLNFSFDEVKGPLAVTRRQRPLPDYENNPKIYYSNFLPFILEEARAIIAAGLEKVTKYLDAAAQRNRQRNANNQNLSEVKPFDLVLQKKSKLPSNARNPLTLNFKGAVSDRIDHGKSMMVLLLKIPATSESPEKRWLALATENFAGTETYAKIVVTFDDYEEFASGFKKDAKWQAHYLGCVISEQRMFDHCLLQIEGSCMKQIMCARISPPNIRPNAYVNAEVDDLNQSQKEALYAFFNAPEGTVLLLQGPPGTGKTFTLVNLLKCAARQDKRILVSAHSNKGVLVLAKRAHQVLTDTRMILIGVESKVPDELKPIFLNLWYDNIAKSFATHNEKIQMIVEDVYAVAGITKPQLLQDFTMNLALSKGSLNKFDLLYFQRLDADSKAKLRSACGNDPVTVNDFETIQSTINALQRDNNNRGKWQELLSKQTVLMEKWTRMYRGRIESHLLDCANIIFSTLITSGRDSIDEMLPIDYLLVDEAAQSVEAATMIPMRFQPKKVLLVGDTKQLPATVISDYLDEQPVGHPDTHYKWSMMWRLIEENKQPSLMLDIQYRMHPQICWWPSEKYYENRLITAPDILSMMSPQLTANGITSRPYAIYHVDGQEKNEEFSHSICNDKEANYVVSIIALIRRQNPDKSIGVITPYSAQKLLITRKINQKHLKHELVDVNTVDGFQGDERDVIIISFTRTHVSTFLKEFRRLNVAITRPKRCLIILANPGLTRYDIGYLLEDAQRRHVVFSEAELQLILRTSTLPTQTPRIVVRLAERALVGNPQAQYEYHLELRLQNLSLSLMWLRKAAEQGHSLAQFALSKLYQAGNHSLFRKNIPLALKWLHMSAEQGCNEAQFDLANKFIQGGTFQINIVSGIYWCKRAADNNHLEAIIFLARCYSLGRHVSTNQDTAISYFRLAAQLNHLASMLELARLLEARNHIVEAIQWYRILLAHQQHEVYYPLSQLLGETVEGLQCLQQAG
jgi:TPR repeat protein